MLVVPDIDLRIEYFGQNHDFLVFIGRVSIYEKVQKV